jgi:hypothetical protein
MFDRLSRSWHLIKASASVLIEDKTLILFPLISSVAALAVVACFALPMFALGALDGLAHGRSGPVATSHYVIGFLFYLSQYFVIFFCNTALVGAAMKLLDGESPTLGDGFRIAGSKVYAILGYAAVAATVGIILRAIQERVGFIGRIIAGLLGMGWTLATYLVVPVLVAKDVGPIEAIKESASLFKRTWGENVIGQAGLGFAFGLIYLGVIMGCVMLILVAAMAHSVALAVLIGVAAICALVITSLVHAALTGIYAAALYRYATDGTGAHGFDSQALKMAFQPKP